MLMILLYGNSKQVDCRETDSHPFRSFITKAHNTPFIPLIISIYSGDKKQKLVM